MTVSVNAMSRCSVPLLRALRGRGRQRIAQQKRAHHVRTLDALALIHRDARARGGQLVRTRLETELRLEQQGGRFTQRGDMLEPVPDAACTIDVDGNRIEVAVEYVTSKYTDKDIARKRDAFANNCGACQLMNS
jgi:hypothetical protein